MGLHGSMVTVNKMLHENWLGGTRLVSQHPAGPCKLAFTWGCIGAAWELRGAAWELHSSLLSEAHFKSSSPLHVCWACAVQMLLHVAAWIAIGAWERLKNSRVSFAGTQPLLRRCWYTGKLYCHNCHSGQTGFLPAQVRLKKKKER